MDILGALDAVERELERSMPFILLDAAQVVVTAAKSGHPWQNRTGRLEGAIRTDSVRGSLRTGYTITVVGATPYGSYLEEGTHYEGGTLDAVGANYARSHWAFLRPAYERTGDTMAREVAEAMADVINGMH